MRIIGILSEGKRVPCATCNHVWDVTYFVNDLRWHQLPGDEGFAVWLHQC